MSTLAKCIKYQRPVESTVGANSHLFRLSCAPCCEFEAYASHNNVRLVIEITSYFNLTVLRSSRLLKCYTPVRLFVWGDGGRVYGFYPSLLK
jgi:hypothetical protein